jgi:outer membrane protein TolC
MDSIQRRYTLGAANYYEVLIAQQQLQKTKIDLVEAQAQRLIRSIAFFQAMGGGGVENSHQQQSQEISFNPAADRKKFE